MDKTAASPPESRPDLRPVASLPWLRWAGLLVLLIAEVLLLSLRFDTEAVRTSGAWWALIIVQAKQAFRLALTVAVATLLFGGPAIGIELRRQDSPSATGYRWWLFLAAHGVALGLFTRLTFIVLEQDLPSSSDVPGVWVGAWLAAGIALVFLWGLACLPPSLWLRLARRRWSILLLGCATGTAAWAAGLWADLLWSSLGRATLTSVHGLLTLLFPGQVSYEPDASVIRMGAFAVAVTQPCSGFEGMGLITVFLCVYLWLFRQQLRFPGALVLVPLGIVAMWLMNVLRITVLIVIGAWGWPDVAMGGFHSQAGWLGFIAVALGLMTVAGRLPGIAVSAGPRESEGRPNATVAYIGPFLAILLAWMIGTAFSSGFEWAYPLRVIAAVAVLWLCRGAYGELRGSWSWPAVGIGVIAFGTWFLLAPAPQDGEEGWPAALREAPLAWSSLWLAFRLAGHVTVVPVAEELAFRGYLPRRFTTVDFLSRGPGDFSWLALLASSVLFGAMHGRAFVAATLVGILFGLAVRRRGQLLDAVLAHATANALVAITVLSTGRWSLWQ